MEELAWNSFDLSAINNQVPLLKRMGVVSHVDQEGTERGWCTLNIEAGHPNAPIAVCVKKVGLPGFFSKKVRWLAVIMTNPDSSAEDGDGELIGCCVAKIQAALWSSVQEVLAGRAPPYATAEEAMAAITQL